MRTLHVRIVLLGFTLFVFWFGRAMATPNLAVDLCTSCTTVAEFQAYAEQNIPSGAYFGAHMNVLFNIVNPDDFLAADISAHGICLSTADGAPCTWDYTWDDITTTTDEMQVFYADVAPPYQIQVPSSVATTFTGSSQAAVVSAWLYDETSGDAVPIGTNVVTVFPDNSTAEYQVTGSGPAYAFVSDSGHEANGIPESDSGDPVSVTVYVSQTAQRSFSGKITALPNLDARELTVVGPSKGMSGPAYEAYLNSFPVIGVYCIPPICAP